DVDDKGVFTLSYDFDPGKDMDFTFKLSWEWAFEQLNSDEEAIALIDQADTFLGNWAAVEYGEQEIEGFEAPAAPSSLEIGATLTASATQID
ncbi:MAG: hypothetical protein J5879_00570, partial [Clostridia bacterium]|nr:hypothetical protein [Clostridia bacterium]